MAAQSSAKVDGAAFPCLQLASAKNKRAREVELERTRPERAQKLLQFLRAEQGALQAAHAGGLDDTGSLGQGDARGSAFGPLSTVDENQQLLVSSGGLRTSDSSASVTGSIGGEAGRPNLQLGGG